MQVGIGIELPPVRAVRSGRPDYSQGMTSTATRIRLMGALIGLGALDAGESPLAIDEDWSQVSEVFSSGTAAGTTHIRSVTHAGEVLFERDRPGPVATAIGAAYEDLLRGRRDDPEGWRMGV